MTELEDYKRQVSIVLLLITAMLMLSIAALCRYVPSIIIAIPLAIVQLVMVVEAVRFGGMIIRLKYYDKIGKDDSE